MADPLIYSYGKDGVSVYRTDGQSLLACEIRLEAAGPAFLSSFTEGDNSLVVATDSMKNFIQRTALEFEGAFFEDLVAEVARRFLARYEHVERVYVNGHGVRYVQHGSVRQHASLDVPMVWLDVSHQGIEQNICGLEDLQLLKLGGSSFAGFVRDEFTTLPETEDRPLQVYMDVRWRNLDFDRRASAEAVRQIVVDTFEGFVSASIQHLLNEMADRIFKACPEIEEVQLSAENRLWDTAAESDSVRVYTDPRPPFGVISLVVRR
jgi:urate oxidase / 2-oxo-4-hydroxy-4-carboxy-5-ureidoimidazoline decarboxylase